MSNPALRKRQDHGYDSILTFAVLGLLTFGLVMVYSASSALAAKSYGTDIYFFKKQMGFALLGGVALVVLRNVPYELYRRIAYPILLAALICLGLVFAPMIGVEVGGATRWLRAGPVNFQPSEFARLAVIIYLAYSMAGKSEKMTDFSVGIVPHVAVTAVVAGLFYFQPDFGSAVLLVAVAGLMLFVGGARISHLLVMAVASAPFVCLLMLNSAYRLRRILTFLNPWEHQASDGYQIIHSLMAFGTGGVSGVGLGSGYQKLFYLPEPHTDFVFSVLGEELGLVGVCVVLVLYSLLIWRGLAVARRTTDLFGRYLAFGIISAIGLQAIVNMAVTMGLLPTKGLALPFLSYGGSSLLFNMAAMGILANIAARNFAGKSRVKANRLKKNPAKMGAK